MTLGIPLIISGTVVAATSLASSLTTLAIAAGTTSFIASLTNLFTGLSKESLDGRTLSEQESKERIKVGQTQALQSLTVMAEGIYLNTLINKNNNSSGNSSSNNNNVDDQNRPKETVYRGDSSSNNPSKVFENGFNSKGTNNDLMSHVKHSESGNYVSTSKKFEIASEFAGKKRIYL